MVLRKWYNSEDLSTPRNLQSRLRFTRRARSTAAQQVRRTTRKPNTKSCEAGVAFLELGIVMPLLVFVLLIGTVEVGNLINEYQKLTQIAREGVRFASKLPVLEPGHLAYIAPTGAGVTEISTFNNPSGISPESLSAGHLAVNARILQLLYLNFRELDEDTGLFPLSSQWDREYQVTSRLVAENCTTTAYTNSDTPCDDDTRGTVEVSISMVYQSFFFDDFDLTPISVRRSGPYLYPNA